MTQRVSQLQLAWLLVVVACSPRSEQTLGDPPSKPVTHDYTDPAPEARLDPDLPAKDGSPSITSGSRISLSVSNGRRCAVAFDGRDLQAEPPLEVVDVAAGEHRIEIRCAGSKTLLSTFAVDGTTPRELSYEMQALGDE